MFSLANGKRVLRIVVAAAVGAALATGLARFTPQPVADQLSEQVATRVACSVIWRGYTADQLVGEDPTCARALGAP